MIFQRLLKVAVCAIGRKTMCVSKGAYELSDEELEARMAHEMAHIANFDSSRIPSIMVSGAVGNIFIFLLKIGVMLFLMMMCTWVMAMMGVILLFVLVLSGGAINYIFVLLEYYLKGLRAAFDVMLIKVVSWAYVGEIMCIRGNSKCEYDADKFAYKLGYGEGLKNMLEEDKEYENSYIDFNNVGYKHPSSKDRLKHLSKI